MEIPQFVGTQSEYGVAWGTPNLWLASEVGAVPRKSQLLTRGICTSTAVQVERARTTSQDTSWGWCQNMPSLPPASRSFFDKGETLCLKEAEILVHVAGKDGLKSAYFQKNLPFG